LSVLYDAQLAMDWLDWTGSLICQECGGELEPPCVAWHGTTLLLFHPSCAARIAPHLLMDSREATLAADSGPHWRRRLLAGVRHRLTAEELVA
jgi:hypothetical protein